MRAVKEICLDLLQADFEFKRVVDILSKIEKNIHIDHPAASHDKSKIVQQAIGNELCKMLNPGKVSFTPKKGEKTVVMFGGLQGSGKTTTCAKYAYYHQKKGWKPALVSADTYSAVGFEQVMQNAMEMRIPFYGSYMESDPVSVAVEGVERFTKQNCDLIIIDTSGHHKNEAALYKEMHQVAEATKPDLVIFVMDSRIGQAALDQALAFKQSVGDRAEAVIVTKLDSHSKGIGALSAVTATNVPLIFIETGENLDEFEVFNVKRFVSRLLGKGDVFGFVEKVGEGVPVDQQPEFPQYTLRTMYHHLLSILKMHEIYARQGSTLPGDIAESLMLQGCENEGHDEMFKRYLTVLKSIIGELDGCNSKVFRFRELDSFNPKLLNYSRIMRIAKCSGYQVREVMEILEDYKRLAKIQEKTLKILTSALE